MLGWGPRGFSLRQRADWGEGGLTPGRVFCSWRALWAFSADSLAQYVRKAHPAVTGRDKKVNS